MSDVIHHTYSNPLVVERDRYEGIQIGPWAALRPLGDIGMLWLRHVPSGKCGGCLGSLASAEAVLWAVDEDAARAAAVTLTRRARCEDVWEPSDSGWVVDSVCAPRRPPSGPGFDDRIVVDGMIEDPHSAGPFCLHGGDGEEDDEP